jgi:hypothetical protein
MTARVRWCVRGQEAASGVSVDRAIVGMPWAVIDRPYSGRSAGSNRPEDKMSNR